MYIVHAVRICFICVAHFTWLAWSRTFCNAGSRIEISSPMIPMTTSSSTKVKPRTRWRACRRRIIDVPSLLDSIHTGRDEEDSDCCGGCGQAKTECCRRAAKTRRGGCGNARLDLAAHSESFDSL